MAGEVSDALIARFHARFEGFGSAYGQSQVKGQADNGKMQARSWTVSGTAPLSAVRAHLDGSGPGLGVVMLKEDNTLRFGAIDFDDRTLNLINTAKEIAYRKLPLVLCRSKSGGGHFYCFTKEPVPATLLKQRLIEWCALLGFAATTEIFPKQTSRYNDADIGSWINLPYYHAAETVRYALDDDGNELSLEEFLTVADARSVTEKELENESLTDSVLFAEGPPCLQLLEARGGFATGTKKNGMFDVGVYLQKAFPDTWENEFPRYNAAMAQIKTDELVQITRSLAKKKEASEDGTGYSYQCSQPPINAFCNRGLCVQRKHGIGRSADSQVTIENITRYQSKFGDDAFWIIQIDGQRILLTTADLYHVDRFNIACMSQANVIPITSVTPQKWKMYLNVLISRADVVQLPDDATPTGQVWGHVEAFCTQQVNGLSREEVWQGKTWTEGGRVYFRSKDLFAYLEAKRVKFKSEQWVWALLSELGGQKSFWNLSGKGVNVWGIPEFEGHKVEEGLGEIPETDAVFEDF